MTGSSDTSLARRRVLSMALGALVVPTIGTPAHAARQPIYEWVGTALGAPARILVAHPDRKAAISAVHSAVMELERIEDQFSLYRDTSALSRLNRDGVLADPSMDMRQLITHSRYLGMLSNGAFDISIQPLWAHLARHFSDPSISPGVDNQALVDMRRLVDCRRIKLSDRHVTLAWGMSLTMNGIAQGYATDCVTSVLRASGFADALVELGEVYGLGNRSPSAPWQVGIRESSPDHTVPLAERALAVSSTRSKFSAGSTGYSHILDPRSGLPATHDRTVYVTHPSATVADALSTALCVMPPEQAKYLIARFPGTEAFEITTNGAHMSLG